MYNRVKQLVRSLELIIVISFGVLSILASGAGEFEWIHPEDNTWPTLPAPRNLTASSIDAGHINLAWVYDGAYQDTTGFFLYRDGDPLILLSSSVSSYDDTNVSGNTAYCYQVSAFNPAHASDRSNIACATTPPDTEAPTAPDKLIATISYLNEVTLRWVESTDNVEVTAYKIYKDGQYLESVDDTTATDNIEGTDSPCYRVAAIDAAGNESTPSNPACIDNAWKIETLSSNTTLYDISTAIDSTDHVHIVYYDTSYGEINYRTNATGAWVSMVIDYVGASETPESSIAVDSQDKVHISYSDPINLYLKYASNTSGNWVSEVIDANHGAGLYNSIAVDTLDKVHISYNKNGLSYITNATGSWVQEQLDFGAASPLYNSIDTDSENNVFISYRYSDYTVTGVKLITNKSGLWVSEMIAYTVSSRSSLAVDSADNIHICYNYYGLKYVTNSSGLWVTYSPGDYGNSNICSISTDSKNKIHISEQGQISLSRNLAYVTNQSGEWMTFTVDSGINSGVWYNAIAVDSNDKAHIVYYNTEQPNYNLMYATNSP